MWCLPKQKLIFRQIKDKVIPTIMDNFKSEIRSSQVIIPPILLRRDHYKQPIDRPRVCEKAVINPIPEMENSLCIFIIKAQ